MNPAFIYILARIKNGEFYIGSASDVAKRLSQHNAGYVQATKHKRPYKLVFSQKFESTDSAHKTEGRLKKMKRRDYIQRIIDDGYIRMEID
jgi:putative endonuclease